MLSRRTFGWFIGGALIELACQDPKSPAPCTGTEQWPDPCAPNSGPDPGITETKTDASVTIPMQPDAPTRKPR